MTDHCQTAADVMAAARRATAFRLDIQRRPALLAREQERRRVAEQAAHELAEDNARAAALAAEEARKAISEAEKKARPAPAKLTVHRLVVMAADILGTTYHEICSDRRSKPMPDYRHCIAWCARELTLRSLPSIGKAMGGRDHTTILHGIRRIEADIAACGELGQKATKLKAEIVRRFSQEQGAK